MIVRKILNPFLLDSSRFKRDNKVPGFRAIKWSASNTTDTDVASAMLPTAATRMWIAEGLLSGLNSLFFMM